MSGVRVRVPATTANIGPGFDCLGCALTLYASFECGFGTSGLEISGCPEAFRGANNLFVQAFRRAERALGAAPRPIRVRIDTDVPVSRGLGSSATLLAGGVAAANALYGGALSREAMVALCTELEGHPDNVAPAVLGGMCASLMHGGKPVTAQIDVSPRVGFVALIPDYEAQTRAMRAVLPEQVSFADAAFNVSHAAVLLRAFETGDLAQIGAALDDRLHQPYRTPLLREWDRAREAALDAGCAAFCLSGSGSTCLGIADSEQKAEIAARITRSLAQSACRWRVEALDVDRAGVVCAPV